MGNNLIKSFLEKSGELSDIVASDINEDILTTVSSLEDITDTKKLNNDSVSDEERIDKIFNGGGKSSPEFELEFYEDNNRILPGG